MTAASAKQEAKDRDGWECRFCGMDNDAHKEENGEALHAHHIVRRSDDGSDYPKNLITVCKDCHTLLEKTQSRALSRIRNDHVENETEELREELREEVEERERLENELHDKPEGNGEVFAWFDPPSVTLHVLVEGLLSPDIRFFRDASEATEAYENANGSAKLFTKNVRFGEAAIDAFRYVSTQDIEMNISDNRGTHFNDGEGVDSDRYLSGDIPDDLMKHSSGSENDS